MVYPANKLITEAYYTSNIVARGYEEPSAAMINNGLDSLNRLLASTAYDKGTIPYYTKYEFTAVIGQEKYFIENLIAARILTFTINSMRFSLYYQQRDAYFGSFRANNIQSLMFINHIERTKGGADLYMYFLPNAAYPCELWGIFKLEPVTQFQDLSLTFDDEYINYLYYALPRYICIDSGRPIPPEVQKQYDSIYETLNNNSSILDMTVQKESTFTNSGSPNYGMANLGTGWLPPSTWGA